MSISKSQAQAIADGFLDDIGSTEEFVPRETFSELILLAADLAEEMTNNLNRDNSNASGKLSSSIAVTEPEEQGSTFKADVEMNFYGDFVNSGVKGTKSGQGKYRFKSSFPSTNMVKALAANINRAKRSTRNTSNRTVSQNETKNRNLSNIQKAYGAGRNIKMYGIKATGFVDRAVAKIAAEVEDRFGKALEIDIINSLK